MKLYIHKFSFRSAVQKWKHCFFMNISRGIFVSNSMEELPLFELHHEDVVLYGLPKRMYSFI
jgi:hypothetical protein